MPTKLKLKPYTFVLTDIFDKPLILDKHRQGNIIAHCPPFHILLDHTIAVLWIVFSQKLHTPLRSSQISWALRFLEGMTNEGNSYAEDIEKSIKMLESILANCIAEEKPWHSFGSEEGSSEDEQEQEQVPKEPPAPEPPRKHTIESLILHENDF